MLAIALLSLNARDCLAGSNAAAEALFNKGRVAMESKDYDTACGHFRESDRLEAAAGTKLNLANCEEQRGRVATAWALYKSVAASLDEGDDRSGFVEEKISALKGRVPYVTLIPAEGTPEGVTVTLGGTEFSSGSFNIALPIDPGDHLAVVRGPDGRKTEISVHLAEGESRELRFALETSPGSFADSIEAAPAPTPANAAPTPPDPAVDQGATRSSGAGRTLGFVSVGLGGALFLGGAVAGALVLKEYKTHRANCWDPDAEYPNGGCYPEGVEARKSGEKLAPYATIGMVGGAVLSGLGIVLILTSDSDATTGTTLRARPIAGGADLFFSTHF